MKRIIPLLVLLLVFFSACQKRQYPQMGKPQYESYNKGKAAAPVLAAVTTQDAPGLADQQQAALPVDIVASSAVSTEGMVPRNAAAKTRSAQKSRGYTTAIKTSVPRNKRVIGRTADLKPVNYVRPEKIKEGGNAELGIVFAFLFGVIGLTLLIAGVPVIALLLGILGFILSLIGLKKVRREGTPRSSKVIGIIGLVLNSVLVAIFLFYLVFALAYAAG